MSSSRIEWTDRTWNPVTGCSKISQGCTHCYAETMTRRLQGMGQEKYKNGFNLTLHPEALEEPCLVPNPTMFFVCSMSDLFHRDVPFDFIDSVMVTIENLRQHTFQILTKRPQRMYEYFVEGRREVPYNAWLGTSVEMENYKWRIEELRGIESDCCKFLSCEPLLGDLGRLDLTGIDWVIVGGESGNQARPMQKDWVLNILHQCEDQGVPFYFKQWGTYGEDGVKRNKKANGSTIGGKSYRSFPDSSRALGIRK